jgi:hypothetical protein
MISGEDTVCQGYRDVAYSIPEIAGAASYIWTLPPGATVTGSAFSPEILISFSDTASSGSFMVRAANACGDGPVSQEFKIVVENCTGMGEYAGPAMALYPNPTTGVLMLDHGGDPTRSPVIVRVYNITGNELMHFSFHSRGTHVFTLENHPAGVYIVRVTIAGRTGYWKIVKL